jgi:hypothetical protein
MRVVTIARKSLDGAVVVENVTKHGTGAFNLERSRIPGMPRATGTVRPHAESGVHGIYGSDKRTDRQQRYDANLPSGRWPTNVILQGTAVVSALQVQSGQRLTSALGTRGTAASYFKQVDVSEQADAETGRK